MALQWYHACTSKGLPPNPVFAGNDNDGTPMYVGRAMYSGECCTAKIIPSKNIAYISHGGKEIQIFEYDVLTGLGVTWLPSKKGETPRAAVECGRTSTGETIYIGRAHHDKSITPGKVIQSHQCIYYGFGGVEHKSKKYEVLVLN